MEFTVHWFWIIKSLPIILLGIFVYMYVKYRCRSHSVYCWLIGMAVIFSSIASSTIKLKVEPVTVSQTKSIEKTKVLPEKKEDNEFKHKVVGVVGITKEDLK